MSTDFEMKMRASGVSGAAYLCDDTARENKVVYANAIAAVVRIAGFKPIWVRHHDEVSIAALPTAEDDPSGRGSTHWPSAWQSDVDSVVAPAPASSPSKPGRDDALIYRPLKRALPGTPKFRCVPEQVKVIV